MLHARKEGRDGRRQEKNKKGRKEGKSEAEEGQLRERGVGNEEQREGGWL